MYEMGAGPRAAGRVAWRTHTSHGGSRSAQRDASAVSSTGPSRGTLPSSVFSLYIYYIALCPA